MTKHQSCILETFQVQQAGLAFSEYVARDARLMAEAIPS